MRTAKALLIFIIAFQCGSSLAQSSVNTPQDSVLVIGQVLEEESYTGLPFAHVALKNKATTTDFKGIFKARLSKTDTVSVSYVGYKTALFSVPASFEGRVFETKILLQKDTILLDNANITILPTSIEAFKQAILSLDLTDQEYKNVQKNMGAITRQVLIYDYNKYTMDAAENQRAAMAGPQSFNILGVFKKVKDALVEPTKRPDLTPPPVYYDAPRTGTLVPSDTLQTQKADTTRINN